MELSVPSTRIMFFLSLRLSTFQKDTGEHIVWHQDAKDASFPQEMHFPLLSAASTEIYKSELVPPTLAQAQNALLQTHIVPSKGVTAKLPWPKQRRGGSYCTISIAGEGGLESTRIFPGSPGSGDLVAA